MAGTRSRARSGRRRPSSQSQREHDMVEIVSDGDEEGAPETLVRDGTSALPDGGFSAMPEERQDELVKRLIRLMICRNATKKPVPRQELSRHLFANATDVRSKQKVFKGAFAQAQNQLRTVFGMEMVEIQKQVKHRSSQTQRSQAASQTGSTLGAKAFILVSVLPQEMRVEDAKRKALLGFLTVVGGMILLEPGCRIEQGTLYRALARIGVHVREKHGHKQLNNGNVKELVEKHLPAQWYLEREKENHEFYYTLGPRFRTEIEDRDLIEFVNAVYTKSGSQDGWLDDTSRRELQLRLDQAAGKNAGEEEDEEDEE